MPPKSDVSDPLWALMGQLVNQARAGQNLPPVQWGKTPPQVSEEAAASVNPAVLEALSIVADERERESFTVHVTTLSGRSADISVHTNTCVELVKVMVHEAFHVLPVYQRLVVEDIEMLDGHEIKDYNIQPGGTITLVIAPDAVTE